MTIDEITAMKADIEKLLMKANPLPWRYGQGRIEPMISDEWPMTNKDVARSAVNMLPKILELLNYGPAIFAAVKAEEDAVLAKAEEIKKRRAAA